MKSEFELQKDFINNPELQEQLEYLKTNPLQGMQGGIVMIEAFLKGIRDLGYKDTSFAFNELNDNSMQAGARNIHYDLIGKSNNIEEIIVYDDGHGMVPDMLRIAVAWGGGHRQGSRKGFGKYGYGLPSACLGVAKKYTVYSKTKETDWHCITFDITPLDRDGKVEMKDIVSEPQSLVKLPEHISNFEGTNLKVSDLKQGTIIQVECIDRVKPVQINKLKDTFLNNFGQTYFKLLENTNMYVDNTKVLPVDVLFVTPNAKGYKEDVNELFVDSNKDENYGEYNIKIKLLNDQQKEGEILVRWSRLPGLFAIRNPKDSGYDKVEEAFLAGKTSISADTKSYRWKTMRQNFGIVFRRYGRKMDVISQSSKLGGYLTPSNNDNYWKCEVNFPAELDEHFEVTTSKQQITPSDELLKTLDDAGLFKRLNRIAKEVSTDSAALKVRRRNPKSENSDSTQQSEAEIIATATALTQGTDIASSPHAERVTQANLRKQKRIEEIAAKKNITIEQAVTDYEATFKDRPRVCNIEPLGRNYAFIVLDEHGDTIEVKINSDHMFYKNFYYAKGSSDNTRSKWDQFLLFYADLYFKQSEDYQSFLESFMNKIGESIKTGARKDIERNPDDYEMDLDDDLTDLIKN